MDIEKLTREEKDELLRRLSAEKTEVDSQRKAAYEELRADFVAQVKERFTSYTEAGRSFKMWLRRESEAWFEVMGEYGKLRKAGQLGFVLSDDDFEFQVKGAKVKGFDERADIAEKLLVDFLQNWVKDSEKGDKDPMYKLAMMMIQRNEVGDLDYKSISRLYELEGDFGSPEYSEIMRLFRESNTVEGTAIHFYFKTKDKYNVWHKSEPSFNRM